MKGEEKGQNVYSGSALHYVVVVVAEAVVELQKKIFPLVVHNNILLSAGC